ncbi:RNA polymerase factor sigma-54 [Pelagibius litoralis]|uniref:RNA polymerase sigma-54 factor n=1 Tax=Pelagibius litoralis TaxID=374515 RepID=A0A967EVK3_9PROT|nr:RNA polymerase factor sigma-54 [Pelagibius litoralis]NIA67954.1 RNA polymerase factor sigma-54 [Pelagibius litoralis]
MAATQRLELRQRQSLVMTPQLQQAIKLLQLSNLELAAEVDREIEQNPLLDREDGSSDTPLDTPSVDQRDPEFDPAAEPPSSSAVAGSESPDSGSPDSGSGLADATMADPPVTDSLDQANAERLPAAGEAPLDTDYDNVFTNGASWEGGADEAAFSNRPMSAGRSDDNDFSLEQRLSEDITLRQHLSNQLHLAVTDPVERAIGTCLIDLLDDSGYLSVELQGLAEQLSCPLEKIESLLAKLQRFEPSGIFARSLAECLALQLQEKDRYDPAMQALVENLETLAKGDLARLRKICSVDQEDLADMVAEIKALDPRPALSFDGDVAQPVIPDVLMRPDRKGGWLIELNSDTMPRLLVNSDYYAQIHTQLRSKKEREYLSDRLQSANWLVKALHQRATTILKVSHEIVKQQDAFFRKGVEHMKPLTLRDIATEIEMHESTVSRVTSNKYIATPRGTFELKYFFTASIAGADGTAHSAEAVRHRIKLLIEGENQKKILSDDTIVNLLRQDGVDIARRTVAKYREAMRIPSSVQRRREKSSQARSL